MLRFRFLVRLTCGAALLIYLLYEHGLRLDGILAQALGLSPLLLLMALLLDLSGQSLSAYRWQQCCALAGYRVGWKRTWQLYFSGMFFNICLPTSIGGDVLRVVGMSRTLVRKSVAFSSVFMDRNVGMAALLVLGLASALITLSDPEPVSLEATFFGQHLRLPLWPVFALLILGYCGINLLLFHPLSYRLAERLIRRHLHAVLRNKLERMKASLLRYRQPLSRYTRVFLLSLAYQGSEAMLLCVLGWGLGLPLSFWSYAALLTIQAVAGLLPITVNNIGVRETIFCGVLLGQVTTLGLSTEIIKERAMALALLYLGVVMTSGLFGGLVYLASGLHKTPLVEPEGSTEGAA